MTCIVGIVDDSTVHIGCDSMSGYENNCTFHPRKKIFKKDDMFLFGICGSYAVADVIEHLFYPPKLPENQNAAVYMRVKFIPELRRCLEDYGVVKHNEGSKIFPASFLIGFDGVLFLVQNDFSVLEITESGGAVGSGEVSANAVLFDYHKHRPESVKATDKLKAALEASGYCVLDVGGDLHFDSVTKISCK